MCAIAKRNFEVFHKRIPTKYEDIKCLKDRINVINDIIVFNTTIALPKKYRVWLEQHKSLIEELEFMINEDFELGE